MVGGFNHNFKYKGDTYHVQTEDSGLPRARITTLLYRGGSILAREFADYADISGVSDLDARVEHMMKNQHRLMLKNLKEGVFDARIDQLEAPTPALIVAQQAEVEEVATRELQSRPSSATSPEADVKEEQRWKKGRLDNMVRAFLDAGR